MAKTASPAKDRDYEQLVERFLKSGHYTGYDKPNRNVKPEAIPAQENRARPVVKPERPVGQRFPIENYDRLTPAEVAARLARLSREQLLTVKSYEERHRRRRNVFVELDRRLRAK